MKKVFFLLTICSLFFSGESVFAKRTKKHVNRYTKIPSKYLLEIDLSLRECRKLIGGECFRRDHMRDKPYYHKSRVIIFHKKIFAEQFLKNVDESKNMLLLRVRNGSYKVKTNKGNSIFFKVKGGVVSDLKLIKGSIKREKIMKSECDLAEATYGFYYAYDKSQILEESLFFRDEYNFNGLKEVVLFATKSNRKKILALIRNNIHDLESIKNLEVCKMSEQENYFLKHFTNNECKKSDYKAIEGECNKYSNCKDFLKIKGCNIIFLDNELGLVS